MIGRESHGHRAALTAALALIVAACGGASGTGTPAPQSQVAPQSQAASQAAASQAAASQDATTTSAPAQPSADAGGTGNAISALADLASYKIKIGMTGSGSSNGLLSMGNISMEGTVVLKPAKASDMTLSLGGSGTDAAASDGMKMRFVEVNGKTYMDLGGSLTEATDPSQSSMTDSLSPEKLLSGTSSYMSDLKPAGDEQKNGIATTHYAADATALASAADGLDALGLAGATWTWDVWIAKQGGYVVSYVLKGAGNDGTSLAITLDISDVNSPSNVVTGP